MNDNQTTTGKKGGFIRTPVSAGMQTLPSAGGCCGQPSSTGVQIAAERVQLAAPVAMSGCCGETSSSDADSTGCCGEPAEKQGCCG